MTDLSFSSTVLETLRSDIRKRTEIYRELDDRDAELAREAEYLGAIGDTVSLHCGCSITARERYWSHWHLEYRYHGRIKECKAHRDISGERDE